MSDTLVIGGGIVGMLTARELAQAGERVTLIEMGETGRESTWAGGGIVSPLYPWRYPEPVTALAAWSQAAYPDLCVGALRRDRDRPGADAQRTPDPGHRRARPGVGLGRAPGTEIATLDAAAVRAIEPELAPAPSEALLLPRIAQVRNPRLAKAARSAWTAGWPCTSAKRSWSS